MDQKNTSAQSSVHQKEIRNSIFRLLKIRERSIKEITDKLKSKNYAPEEIADAVKYFKGIDLLNDERFTKQWIRWRLSKPYGFKRIAHELKQKGIDTETVLKEFHNIDDISKDEEKIVYNLVQQRLQRYKNMNMQKKLQRLYAYLSRRGFSAPVIYKVIYDLRGRLKMDTENP